MRSYFFKHFIIVFLLAVTVILIQTGFIVFQYQSSQRDWKESIFVDYVNSLSEKIENRQSLFDVASGIGEIISSGDVSDNRISGILVSNSFGKTVFVYGKTVNGRPFGQEIPVSVSGYVNSATIEVNSSDYTVETVFDDYLETETVMIPSNVKANDLAGSVSVFSDGKLLFTVHLLSFSPRTYVYSKDVINSCFKSMLYSIPVCLIIALISAWIISKRNTKQVNEIRRELNELTQGFQNIEVVHYRDKVMNQIPVAVEKLDYTLQSNRRTQKAWLASISHDLNTPLTAVMMITNEFIDGIIPKTKANILKLQAELDILKKRIDKVIDFSTLQSETEPQLKTINASDFLNSLKKQFYEVEYKCDVENFYSDEQLLYKASCELLDNAMKYGKDVEFQITSDESFTIVKVTDKGTIPEGMEGPVLFEPWTKGDFARSTGGNGLGLPIAGTIANLLDGNAIIKQIDSEHVEASLRVPKLIGSV